MVLCKEVYVARYENELAGFVVLQVCGSFKGYIQTICVKEQFRGCGFGKKILAFCESRILELSPNIFICVSGFNTGAIKLYQSLGFKLVGELTDFIKEGFTELLLRKSVSPLIGYTLKQAMMTQKINRPETIAITAANCHTRMLLLWLAFLVMGSHAIAQSTGSIGKRDLLIATVDSILQSQVDSNHIPGAVIEIKRRAVLYEQAFGFAQKYVYGNQLMAAPEPMTTGHLFDIASLTKVIGTTTAIMLLADHGLIRVDDPVGKYVPAFDSGDKNGSASVTC